MGGSSSNQQQSTTTNPPAYAMPYLQQGLHEASADYGRGGQQQFPGNRIVPLSQPTQAAMTATYNRAMGGSPVTGAAQNLATSTMRGDFLGGNPYLSSQINRAIQLSQGGLASEFSGLGRDVGKMTSGHFPARAEQIKNITNDFLWRNYDAERARQQSMINQAIPLANQDYYDMAQLGNVGATLESQARDIIEDRARRWDWDQTMHDRNLDQYLVRTGQITPQLGGTTISSGPGGSSALGNIGGFMAGAGGLLEAMKKG